MRSLISRLLFEDDGQDIAEYAAVVAVILLLVFSTIRLVLVDENSAFSSVGSSIQ
jgi:Flp pilus assembly pilin Flp